MPGKGAQDRNVNVGRLVQSLAVTRRVSLTPTRLVALSLVAAVALSAGAYSISSLGGATATGTGAGRVTRVPAGLVITSISCPRAGHCWAIGNTWRRNFALRWQGRSWALMSVPVPKRQVRGANAMSLSCPAMNDCWAVEGTDTDADYGDGGSSVSRDVLFHWNGRRWRIVPAPNPSSNDGGYRYINDALQSVWCAAATACWAVGYHDTGQLVLRWNGSYWRRENVPLGVARNPSVDTGAADLDSVFCTSARDCWAAGRQPRCEGRAGVCRNEVDEVLHWTGTSWERARLPKATSKNETIAAVACASHADCWAIGPTGERNQGVHWNGQNWSIAKIPSPPAANSIFGSPGLSGLACSSQPTCWAVGTLSEFSANTGNEVLRWSGRSWRPVGFPQPGQELKGRLYSVSCDTKRSCWVVGGTLPPGAPAELFHWNGRGWHHGRP